MLAGRSRIIYWPFALGPEGKHAAEQWLAGELRDLDVDVDVETWTDLSGHAPNELASAGLLLVGGATRSGFWVTSGTTASSALCVTSSLVAATTTGEAPALCWPALTSRWRCGWTRTNSV